MVSHKRVREDDETAEPAKEMDLLHRIRNMWEFANLSQWIFTFGRAVKINENLDIEEIESECLKPNSTVLSAIGLALLKFVSPHRGLTPEIFDEYTRRQYVAQAPHRNPFGEQIEPARFDDFDVLTKIRVLQQLTQWTMKNPDRIRERMDEQKDIEQTIWRIEQFGWDSEDRTYIVLDDNRLYRRTDPQVPPSPVKPKSNPRRAKVVRRSLKRLKVAENIPSDGDNKQIPSSENECASNNEDDGLGGMRWECIAVTLEEYNSFLLSIDKSRDPNERMLRKRITEDVLPILKKQQELQQRKQALKERELLNIEKLACAKRSSRIAGKMEKQKLAEEARDAERKKAAELAMATKQKEKWTKLEKERETRVMTREQRLKEREARRILHEEELATLSDDSRKLETTIRLSERHLKAEILRNKQAIERLTNDDDWIFDCICGAYGQLDDGTHSIACDKCNTWQHSKCVQVSKSDADRHDFSFICRICERRAEERKRESIQSPIKIKLTRPGLSSNFSKRDTSPASIAVNERSSLNTSSQGSFSQNIHVPNAACVNGRDTYSDPDGHPSIQPPQLLRAHNESIPSESGQEIMPQAQFTNPPNPAYSGSEGDSEPCPPRNFESRLSSSLMKSPQQQHDTKTEAPISNPKSSTSAPSNRSPNVNPSSAPNQELISGMEVKSPPQVQKLDSDDSKDVSQDDPPIILQPGSNTRHRCSSANVPSPFTGAPKLNPIQKPRSNSIYPSLSSPTKNSLSPCHFSSLTSSPISTPNIDGAKSVYEHSLALPPAVTGISPTKTSPPRSITVNGGFGPKTPTMLPPVVSLTPSPKPPNLSPPVKSSEPEWSRPAGQILGQ